MQNIEQQETKHHWSVKSRSLLLTYFLEENGIYTEFYNSDEKSPCEKIIFKSAPGKPERVDIIIHFRSNLQNIEHMHMKIAALAGLNKPCSDQLPKLRNYTIANIKLDSPKLVLLTNFLKSADNLMTTAEYLSAEHRQTCEKYTLERDKQPTKPQDTQRLALFSKLRAPAVTWDDQDLSDNRHKPQLI